MTMPMNQTYEITTDGKTVWVNSSVCLGRFSRFGVDVHKDAEGQMRSGSQCLECSQEPNWPRFVAAMKEHHGIEVSDDYKPAWALGDLP